ncbi:glycosyltransferase [Heyndrickxia sporothermodurans]|uniref:glycosyltransferase n=2 Tax=Heyndrickxia sporothermodurans TaxID=46224 RepID=UPI002E210DF7|nr:glycosyltransferase [Heyndrickxia sporothermodurans]MED3654406.1 glycosyltransferase [Heyndrickxia sporothermodurans]MED3697275.1 glycosyltransferase [Heyndrickxia sporothermodurans]
MILKKIKRIVGRNFRKQLIYVNYLEKKPIQSKMILYEAYHGRSMTGNPYAVFKYLIGKTEFKDFRHIWVIKDKSVIQEEFLHLPNVEYVIYQSIPYVKRLATAKYLINDTTFPAYFQKRKDQVYANIWHGTPLKTMGLDIKNKGFAEHKNIQRNFLFTDYFVSPNKFTYEKLLKSHDIYSIYNGIVLDTGYPRVDLMWNADTNQLKKKLAIPLNKKVILYAPTWRGKLGERKNESIKLAEDVSKIQQAFADDYTVLLKSHYFAHQFFKENGLADQCVPNSIGTNELLSIVDLLITDYSSIFFEFLPMNRPILFYPYDKDEYLDTRGTYIPLNELPGPICQDVPSLIEHIHHIDQVKKQYEPVYREFKGKFCYHDDGNATARMVDTVFRGRPSEHVIKTVTNKTKILLYGGGFLNNGITASLTNLLKSIDYDLYDVTLIDYGNQKEEKIHNLNKINKNVHIIYRVGSWNATIAERLRHLLFLQNGAYTPYMKRVMPAKMYQREMERMVGLAKFDIGIDFSGYSPFWSLLFAFGDFKRKSIFLHSDMRKEIDKKVNKKYPHRKNLQVIFSLYNFYDKVLSVSKLTHEQNKQNLMRFIKEASRKMDYVINTIDYKNILAKKEDYQYEFAMETDLSLKGLASTAPAFPMPSTSNINFITIGRLGPEKDHAKLIDAFSVIASANKNARLYIVGDGALRDVLKEKVKKLQLQDKIIFTGQIDNPYTLLNLCDCFVLSSNQEGQPMVLLEALVLGKPVIVTDIPGSRSVVEGGYGLIVENSIDGLVKGMNDYLEGKRINEQAFDYEAYLNDAINMFYEKVCRIEK